MKTEIQQFSLPPVPIDWTRQKDLEWYSQHFESDGEDPYSEALQRLWHERARLEEALTEWIGIFLAEEEFDPDPATECLGTNTKVDLLSRIIQAQSSETGPSTRFQKVIGLVKAAFEACDQIASYYLLQRDKPWLYQLGTVTEELARSAWELKNAVRKDHQYRRRSNTEKSDP